MFIQNLRCLFLEGNVSSIYFEQNERFNNNKCFGIFVSKCKELDGERGWGGEKKINIQVTKDVRCSFIFSEFHCYQ